jgi:hypothetical protein
MVLLNNIYFNAAYTGFIKGALMARQGATLTAGLVTAATTYATKVDSLIPFDALVTTGASNTQLAITTNTIAANEQWRAGMLHDLAFAQLAGSYTEDAVATDYTARATTLVASWTTAIAGLVTP